MSEELFTPVVCPECSSTAGTLTEHGCTECCTHNCRGCDTAFPGDAVTTVRGRYLCESCFDARYQRCERCDYAIQHGYGYDVGDQQWCSDCFHSHYFVCQFCEGTTSVDEIHTVDNEDWCESCAENHGNWCDSCECYHRPGNNCNSSCNGLRVRGHFDRGYGDFLSTPTDKRTKLFVGVELEVEKVRDEIDRAAVQLLNAGDFFILKYDGSLSDGVEIVTSPMSRDWLATNRPRIDTLLNTLHSGGFDTCNRYGEHTAGMHVHLSRSAFTTLHLYKFMRFIYQNRQFTTLISGRNGAQLDRWASLHEGPRNWVRKAKFRSNDESNRYRAVNLATASTAEVRIFRSTLRPDSFWKNINFVLAAYDFTAQHSMQQVTESAFRQFVAARKRQYKELAQFLTAA